MVKSGIEITSENNKGENQEIWNRIIGRILGIIGLGLAVATFHHHLGSLGTD